MKPEISLIPEPDRSTEERVPLDKYEVAFLMLEQKGICGCGCGEKLQPLTEGFIDEHVIPLAAGGTNDLRNRRLLRPSCAKRKTKIDMGVIAKGKRQAMETGQQARRAKGKTPQIAKPPVSRLSKAAYQAARARSVERREKGMNDE